MKTIKERNDFISSNLKLIREIAEKAIRNRNRNLDRETVKDLVEDTIVRLLECDIDETKSFKYLTYTIASNLAISHFKKNNRIVRMNEWHGGINNSCEEYDVKDSVDYIKQTYNRKEDEILLKFIAREISSEDAAEILGITLTGLYCRANRLRNKIQNRLRTA